MRVDEELRLVRALFLDRKEGQVDHHLVGAGQPFVRIVPRSDAHAEIVIADEVHPEHDI